MDTAYPPTITFTPDLSSALTFAGGSFSNGNTVYTATYNVVDSSLVIDDVDVSVSGARDVAGNVQSPNPAIVSDLFDIDTIGHEEEEHTHFSFGTITVSSQKLELPPGSQTTVTIFVPVTNTHATLASDVNPGHGNTFIDLFQAGTTTKINDYFVITRTDGITVIEPGATANLVYTVTTTASTTYVGGVDVQAYASGRLPPKGAVQITMHTVTAAVQTNIFTVIRPPLLLVESANDGGTVSFYTNAGGFSDLKSLAEETLPVENKPPVNFSNGIFEFTISGVTPGGTAEITLSFPSDIPAGSQYWKVQGGSWFRLPDEFVGDNDGDNILVLILKDGGLGDADGIENGVIVDPGGPVAPVPSQSSGNSCKGRIVVTNDPNRSGHCIIVDLMPPQITSALVYDKEYTCIDAIDNNSVAKVSIDGTELTKTSFRTFCAKYEVHSNKTIPVLAVDYAGNGKAAIILDRIDAKNVPYVQLIDPDLLLLKKNLNALQKAEFEAIIKAILSGAPLTAWQQSFILAVAA